MTETWLKKFDQKLDRPLPARARLALALLVLPVWFSFFVPLWHIHLQAPQYPKGLDLWIYSWKVEGGNDGHDVKEINTLNHYIGMRHLDRENLVDLDWLPFALGALMLLTLRTAVLGNLRTLIDLSVMVGYFSLFSLGRFVYQMYVFGHDLDPRAPMDVPPFMPPVLGSKQIANFTSSAYPGFGSAMMAVFAGGLIVLLFLRLWARDPSADPQPNGDATSAEETPSPAVGQEGASEEAAAPADDTGDSEGDAASSRSPDSP